MKTTISLVGAVVLLAIASSALAGVHYVDLNCTNATPPYTNWATAVTNIRRPCRVPPRKFVIWSEHNLRKNETN